MSEIKAKRSYGIHSIFISNWCEEKQFKARMIDVKADDFLSKPFSSSSMIEKIEHYIKPLIHSENNTVAIQDTQQVFQFGIPELDKQLYGEINPQSFVLIEGEIGETSLITIYIGWHTKTTEEYFIIV